MAVIVSTGFAASILGPSAFETIFLNGMIEVRTGLQPASADAAVTGTLLGRITRDGAAWTAGSPAGGLQFIRDGRFAAKDNTHVWKLDGSGTGTAGWFRLYGNTLDSGAISLELPRIDGRIGLLDAEGDYQMFLPTLAITPSFGIDINQWWYAMPPLGA